VIRSWCSRLFPAIFVITASAALTVPLVFAQAGVVRADKHVTSFDVQQALTRAGYYDAAVDGIIGPKTLAAVRAFQEAEGLFVDGVCGPETWEKLKRYAKSNLEWKQKAEVSRPEDIPQEIVRQNNRSLSRNELKQKLIP